MTYEYQSLFPENKKKNNNKKQKKKKNNKKKNNNTIHDKDVLATYDVKPRASVTSDYDYWNLADDN